MAKQVMEASQAVAEAVKLCRPGVVPMYPITPQTHIVENIAEFINDGAMDAELIDVESEHSAMAAAIGAQMTGVRTFTASASQGLALMHEMLFIASGMRLPIVMAIANRSLSAPLNIWNDHQDAISERDSGWLQLYVESSQEALDTIIHAYKIAENKEVLLPVMVCLDGFALSHVWEQVDMPTKAKVNQFLPRYKPVNPTLDTRKPVTLGPVSFPDTYINFRKMQQDAAKKSLEVIKKVNSEFKRKFRRSYGNGLVDTYKLAGAKYAIVAMGTVCGTARHVVDKMRKEGKRVGLIKVRSFRPFPVEDLISATKGLEGIAIIDRDISIGYEGALYSEMMAALRGSKTKISGFIAGLGGRDITADNVEYMLNHSMKGKEIREEWIL
ncbi:pyruvate ferredoxin oxidoreductase [Candidatus Woesearchaeota archaeon CG10_big_fil_rev_8_21_14_0_10_44_13]|nr:MAG: pyruvate ferredoxin oxidoreductase [Candidatus Woesearchaeota archaeon CG10_big_fil_rev_8_21_14_0_10_44_13]